MKKLNLPNPPVYGILGELLSEHRIFRLSNVYFPEFDDDFRFGDFLSKYINFFLTKIMEKKQAISILMDSPYNPRLVVKDPSDNPIFEFSNVIGALITYTLIETSSLYDNDREPAKIRELINLIFKGVIWENIFYQFGNSFRDTRHKKSFDRLSESLMNVYPRLYETLETNKIKFFKELMKYNPDKNLYENCDHEWKERYMFKCGKFEECVHCRYHRLLK